VQPVWRADRPQKGRFREFFQCDVDAIGSKSMVVETEILAAATDILVKLGFADFTIRLNHRQALSGLLNAGGVPPALHNDALVALDKLDKVGHDGVAGELAARGVPAGGSTKLLEFFASVGDASTNEDTLARLSSLAGANQGVDELRTILALAEATSAGGRIRIDPSLARGLSYYTGAIFEVAVPDLAGSLGGGGRYDNLIGMFLGDEVPACGISLGLERILVVMGERGMFPPDLASRPADVMVTVWNAAQLDQSLALATLLRAAGLRVETYPEADKLGKQFKYAASRAIPCVAIVGDEEFANGTVAVKTMASGDQVSVPRAAAAREIANQLAISQQRKSE
jgi:histidyl-tRNA synthetase